jgi:hypothetical protein
MKHLADDPDLSPVPAAFVPIVRRALLKDPALRYQTIDELAQDVVAAGRGGRPALPSVAPTPPTVLAPAPEKPLPPLVRPLETAWRNRLGEACGSLAGAALVSLATTIAWAVLLRNEDPITIGTLYLLTVGVAWAVLLPSQFWPSKRGDFWTRRAVLAFLGAGLGLFAAWLGGWEPRGQLSLFDPAHAPTGLRSASPTPVSDLIRDATKASGGYIVFFVLALGAMRWWKLTDRRRTRPVRLTGVIAAAFWGLVLSAVWPQGWAGPVALVSAALVVQWVSPWNAPLPTATAPKRVRLRSIVTR